MTQHSASPYRGRVAESSMGVPAPPQEVRFSRAPDGPRLAWARHGSGPPRVIASCWLSHLQYDWQSPVWRHFLDRLGDIATVVRYDERGYGLSDWDVDDFTLESRVADLETIVDDAGLDRFALMGMSQGGPVAIEYAHRHPERVTRLVFYGAHASLRPEDEEEVELDRTFVQMIRVGWDRPDSTFRRVFTSSMIPSATEEQKRWVDELLRMSTSAGNAVAARLERELVDVRDRLPHLTVPTLVLHSKDDRMMERERGLAIASAIPNARLVLLESENHIVLSDEPAWQTFLAEVTAFLAPERREQLSPALSPREREIVLLAAEGLDNTAIATRLTLSVRTVERHLQNVYLKLGVSGSSGRAAAVARVLGS